VTEAPETIVDDVRASRAMGYVLLATLLARAPSRDILEGVAGLKGDLTAFGESVAAVGKAAALTTPPDAEREFNRLFIGVERGELVPYASYYRSGFLQDRALLQVRAAMTRLGIERAPEVTEPEDHVAALLEIMGGLIDGSLIGPVPEQDQKNFFDEHLAPWTPRFFDDLRDAASSRLYHPVGILGRQFMEIESIAFAIGETEFTQAGRAHRRNGS